MDLAGHLRDALECAEMAFEIRELRREIERSREKHREEILAQKHAGLQTIAKAKEVSAALRACRCLGRLGENVAVLALRHAEELHSRLDRDVCVLAETQFDAQNCKAEDLVMQREQQMAESEARYNAGIADVKKRWYGEKVSAALAMIESMIGATGRVLDMQKMHACALGDVYQNICERRLGLLKTLIESEETVAAEEKQSADALEQILEKVLAVLSQGTLENDMRFAALVNETVASMERFDAPEIARMSVQFVVARKYVEDVISLKQDPLLNTYLR